MKRFLSYLVIMAAFMLTGCSNNDLYEDLPTEIQQFVSQYFPNSKLDSFTAGKTSYRVVIDDGPGLTFDKDCRWTSVNGYGEVLPQVLLYDQLPPELYAYLEETEQTHGVFAITRSDDFYTVTLLTNTLTYSITTGQITGDK